MGLMGFKATLGEYESVVGEGNLSRYWLKSRRSSSMAAIFELHWTTGASFMAHVRMFMACVKRSSGVIEGWVR